MNTQMLVFVVFAFACVDARSLNAVFGGTGLNIPSFSGDVFEQFQSLPTNPFYGFDAVGGTTQTASTDSDNGFAQGGFSSLVVADNEEDDSGTISGGAVLTSIADDVQSGVSLVSENTADANGPGVSGIVGGGFGNAQFGNSNAGFGVFVSGEEDSDDATTTADIVGGALTRDGFSASATQFCVGSNCP